MRLVSLNTWGGRVTQPLYQFFKENQDVDIFCLQEVFNNAEHRYVSELLSGNTQDIVRDLYSKIQKILPNHNGFFTSVFDEFYGQAIFVRKDIKVLSQGEIVLFENRQFPSSVNPDMDHTRKMQWIRLIEEKNNLEYCVMNIHGHWDVSGKSDTDNRIIQSNKIKNFIRTLPKDLKKIVCGDFNLRPDTKSISILESEMVNLINTNNILSTRTSLYKKGERFADYILVSRNILLKDFKVLSTTEVSDHSVLLLDC